jgi:disulfide bond formation protein DsbB
MWALTRTRFLPLLVLAIMIFSACSEEKPEGDVDVEPARPPAEAADAVAHGEELFRSTCSSCHGSDGTGVAGLGKPLRQSEFIQAATDSDLLDLLKEGRPVEDDLNTTGIPMPPRGGNSNLSDQDLQDIIVYLRTLQS